MDGLDFHRFHDRRVDLYRICFRESDGILHYRSCMGNLSFRDDNISCSRQRYTLEKMCSNVPAYALDVFPDTAVQASALLNIFRTTGGFIVNYFQVQWAQKNGAAASFGTQG